MVKHLDAVCEHGILRPLEPLALAEHQRVHLTVDESTAPLSWLSSEPVNDRLRRSWAASWVTGNGAEAIDSGVMGLSSATATWTNT